jgi:hypothetical protein
MITVVYYRKRLADFDVSPRDFVILLTVPTVLMILVSSQLEFNHHVRYVLPVLGYLYVLSGVVSLWFTERSLT